VEDSYTALARVYDALMYDVDYKEWAAYIASLLKENGVEPGADVLDAACGTGTLSLLLYRAGFGLTALDLSEDMLNAAARKFRESGADIPLVRQDMRHICLHKKCAAVVCTCDGVNYLPGKKDTAAFFKSAYGALKEDGILLFDVSTEYKLSRVIADNVFCDEAEDMAYIWKNTFKARKSVMELTLFLREGDVFRRYSEIHTQRVYPLEELREALYAAGFGAVNIYAFPTKDKTAEATERAQFVARKKAT